MYTSNLTLLPIPLTFKSTTSLKVLPFFFHLLSLCPHAIAHMHTCFFFFLPSFHLFTSCWNLYLVTQIASPNDMGRKRMGSGMQYPEHSSQGDWENLVTMFLTGKKWKKLLFTGPRLLRRYQWSHKISFM